MRTVMTYAVVCLVVASAAMAQVGTQSETPPPGRTASTLDLLNQRLPEVMFEELPLEQVMEFIADFTQMNVVVRWEILEDAGIERDKAITIKVRNVHLRQVLWLIMNEAGGTDLKLAYRASGNMLVLSTEEDLGPLLNQPSDVTEWHGPYIKRGIPKDPWGNPYGYRCPGQHNTDSYDLYSFGPDGREAGGDDIDNWSER